MDMTQRSDGWYILYLRNGDYYAWVPSGYLNTFWDRDGNYLAWNYNADGTVASVQDTQGRYTYFWYSIPGKITRVTDPAGIPYQYSYDAAGNHTSDR